MLFLTSTDVMDGRLDPRRQPSGSKVRLFLTSTDVRDGRLDPREAAIRVKGEALPDLYRCQGWDPREAAIWVKGESCA